MKYAVIPNNDIENVGTQNMENRITFRLDDETLRKLQTLAKQNKISKPEVIRRLINKASDSPSTQDDILFSTPSSNFNLLFDKIFNMGV